MTQTQQATAQTRIDALLDATGHPDTGDGWRKYFAGWSIAQCFGQDLTPEQEKQRDTWRKLSQTDKWRLSRFMGSEWSDEDVEADRLAAEERALAAQAYVGEWPDGLAVKSVPKAFGKR